MQKFFLLQTNDIIKIYLVTSHQGNCNLALLEVAAQIVDGDISLFGGIDFAELAHVEGGLVSAQVDGCVGPGLVAQTHAHLLLQELARCQELLLLYIKHFITDT